MNNEVKLIGRVVKIDYSSEGICKIKVGVVFSHNVGCASLANAEDNIFDVYAVGDVADNAIMFNKNDDVEINGHLKIDVRMNASKTNSKRILHIYADKIIKAA